MTCTWSIPDGVETTERPLVSPAEAWDNIPNGLPNSTCFSRHSVAIDTHSTPVRDANNRQHDTSQPSLSTRTNTAAHRPCAVPKGPSRPLYNTNVEPPMAPLAPLLALDTRDMDHPREPLPLHTPHRRRECRPINSAAAGSPLRRPQRAHRYTARHLQRGHVQVRC